MELCWKRLRVRATRVLLGFVGALIVCALLAAPAQAFTVQGGTAAQRAYVGEVINACALPFWLTDADLRACGPVKVVLVNMDGVTGYAKIGTIYVNSDFAPGEVLAEMVAHEWAHQIWYSLGPKWWQKWSELCDPSGLTCSESWNLDCAENFAECARMTLWGSEYSLRDYACTDLAVIDPADTWEWLSLARYVNQCPFVDLEPKAMPSTAWQDELAGAAGYVYAAGIMQGFTDTTFRPEVSLTKGQLATICGRAGLSYPLAWRYSNQVATRGEVRMYVPGLEWTAGDWQQPITRGHVARLIWRAQ